MTKRYAVLNASNQVVNVILVNDPLPAKYWPGYGAKMICLDGEPSIPNGSGIPVITGLTLSQRPQIGDVVVIATGTVLRYVPNLIQQDGVTVSSAPQVKLVKDVEPTK